MAQDAIARIAEAEEQAEVLCRVAEERAAERRADMEKMAKAHFASVERTATQEKEQRLAQTRAGVDALLQKKREEAEAEAKSLTDKARERMDDAVQAIVWGILERCQ